MKNPKYLLVFGTLKRDCESGRNWNFDRFGEGTQKVVKKVTLKNFEMYSLGPYPAVCESAPGENSEIQAELHEVDGEAAGYIEGMERGAGYTGKKVTLEDGTVATIYTWPREKLVAKYQKIESGSWD